MIVMVERVRYCLLMMTKYIDKFKIHMKQLPCIA